MRSAFSKDTLRTITGTFKRFLSIATICMLGVTMMVGLTIACEDLRISADQFFDAQQLWDVSVQSTLGLTDSDVAALAALDGVEAAEGSWSESAYVAVGDARNTVSVYAFGEGGMNQPYVLEGTLPDNASEIAVTKEYLEDSGKKIGDTVTFDSGDVEGDETETSADSADDADNTDDASNGDPDDDSDDDSADLDSLSDEEEDSEVFERKDYTITAVVIDPMSVAAKNGTSSFRATGSRYSFFVTRDAAALDTYSIIYLRVKGASELSGFSDEYENLVAQVTAQAEQIKDEREQARTNEVLSEATSKIDDAEAEANEEFDKAEQELADAQATIDDALAQIASGQAELNSNRASALAQLADAQAEINSSKAELEASEATLNENKPLVESGLEQAKTKVVEAQAAVDTTKAAVDQAKQGIDVLNQTIAAAEAKLAENPEDIEAQATLEYAKNQLKTAEEGLTTAQGYYSQATDGLAQAQAAVASLEQNLADINRGLEQIASGYEQLEQGQTELNNQRASALAQLSEAQAELNDAKAEAADGQAELDENRETYEQEKADALQKIADARAKLGDIESATWYVQDRNSISSYSSIDSDASCIEVIGTVFPAIFLTVAILISLTTATRMVEEERGLIGLYKALGYGCQRIMSKYIIYTVAAAVLGDFVGCLLGFLALPYFLFQIFAVMYTLPAFTLNFSAPLCALAVGMFIVGIGLATLLTVRKELQEQPAVLMRPRAPKAGTRILLEKIKPIWNRLSFLNKVTARNLFRYKRRMAMTIFGVAGCTALLICGFAINDTVLALSPNQYGDASRMGVYTYDLLAVTQPEDLEDAAAQLTSDNEVVSYIAVRTENITVEHNNTKETVQLVVVPDGFSLDGYIDLRTEAGEHLALEEAAPIGQVLATKNASTVLGFGAGDTLNMQDMSLGQASAPVSAVVMNYLGNAVYMSEATYETLFGTELEANALIAKLNGEADEQIAYKDTLASNSIFLSVTSIQEGIRDFSANFMLINSVIVLITVLAAGLSFVVLFTLSTTNISERERELATIKVLGFRKKEVRTYIYKELIALAIIGTIVGIPLGAVLGHALTYVLNMPSMYFAVEIHAISYVYSCGMSLLFALIVCFITNPTLDRIDMVGALKSAE